MSVVWSKREEERGTEKRRRRGHMMKLWRGWGNMSRFDSIEGAAGSNE